MPVFVVEGDLFNTSTEGIVIPVNCIGVAGAGVALEARSRYPDWFRQYALDCSNGALRVGTVTVCGSYDKFLFNFPTKETWKLPSQYAYIEFGLPALRKMTEYIGVKSIGTPALGCGLGGLDFTIVRTMIKRAFHGSDIDVLLYTPEKHLWHVKS